MAAISMSKREREEFLAAVHVGVLAVAREDGPPLVTPVWYRYASGGDIEFTTARDSEKARLLAASGRASLCAQSEALPYAYVTVDGPVETVDANRDAREDIAVRYLGEELGAAYLSSTGKVDNVMVRLRPERWRTVDYAKLDLQAP
jgi:PPOX class probable F420-dependent enzyme